MADDGRELQPPPRKPGESAAAYQYRLDRYLKDRAQRPGESREAYAARMKRRDDAARRKRTERDKRVAQDPTAKPLTRQRGRVSAGSVVSNRTEGGRYGTDEDPRQEYHHPTDADYDGHDLERDSDCDTHADRDTDEDMDRDTDGVTRDVDANVISLADRQRRKPKNEELSDSSSFVPTEQRDMRDMSRDTGRGGLGGFHPGSGRGSNPSRSNKNKDLEDKTRVTHVTRDDNRVPDRVARRGDPEHDPRPILHMTSGPSPVVTYDTPEARAHFRRERLDQALRVTLGAFEHAKIPWEIFDVIKPLFDRMVERDPDKLEAIAKLALAHSAEVGRVDGELFDLRAFKKQHDHSRDPERLRIVDAIKTVDAAFTDHRPLDWQGDRDFTVAELESHPIEVYVARGYQLSFLMKHYSDIDLTPASWSPMSVADVASLMRVWEAAIIRHDGDVDAALGLYMAVVWAYRMEIPGPRPWTWSPEQFGKKGPFHATYMTPNYILRWTRRLMLLRWETAIGLPFDFEPGDPSIEDLPPAFAKADQEGRSPRDLTWWDDRRRDELRRRQEALQAELNLFDRR